MPGKALTLNASVAAALLIYEVIRKRGAGDAP
jgi:tRNA G18 (ribose-2'-O)-methylase SpoU